MRYFDHKHMNGCDVRRILTNERQQWRWVPEVFATFAFIAAIAAIVTLFAVLAP